MLLTTIRDIGPLRYVVACALGAAGVYAACWVFLVAAYALLPEVPGFPPGVMLVEAGR